MFPVRVQEVGIEAKSGSRIPFYQPIGAPLNSLIDPHDSATFADEEDAVHAAGIDMHQQIRGYVRLSSGH